MAKRAFKPQDIEMVKEGNDISVPVSSFAARQSWSKASQSWWSLFIVPLIAKDSPLTIVS